MENGATAQRSREKLCLRHVAARANPRSGPFARFPHYETFFENAITPELVRLVKSGSNPLAKLVALANYIREVGKTHGRVVELLPQQIEALAGLTAWSLCTAAATGDLTLPAAVIGSHQRCPES
jgi:hypothetical protein